MIPPGNDRPTVPRERFLELDGLRGLAAFAVVIYHFTDPSFFAKDARPALHLWVGTYGVHLFFMISGYVILVSALRARRSRDFVVSRFSRLYPPYWIALTLTAVLIAVFGVAASPAGTLTPALVAINATMFQRWLNVENVDLVYWTLGVELQFYALMLALLIVTRANLTARLILRVAFVWVAICLGTAIAVAPTTHGVPLMHAPLTTKLVINATVTPYGPLFCFGLVVYLAKRGLLPWWPATVIAPVTVAIYAMVEDWTSAGVVAILIVCFAFVATRDSVRPLTWAPIQWLGRRSYSLYIGHLALGLTVLKYTVEPMGPNSAVLLATCAALGWSAILYEIGEKRLSSRIRALLTRRSKEVLG